MRMPLRAMLGLSLGLLVSSAAAADRQIVPGSLCRFEGVQNLDTFFSTTPVNGNGLKNTSTVNRVAICPLVRDSMGTLEYASVTALGRVSCELRTFSPGTTGSIRHSDIDDWSEGDLDLRRISFLGGGGRLNQSDTSYVFRCTVPAGASVLHMHADES